MINQAQFKKNLVAIKKGEKRFTMIHETACFALSQVNEHGQTTPANELLTILHKGDRVEALKVWFKDFGKVKEEKDGTLKYSHKRELMLDGEVIEAAYALQVAEATPYFEYTKEIKPASSYDVMKGIRSILSKAKKTKGEGKPVEHEELLATLAALLPTE